MDVEDQKLHIVSLGLLENWPDDSVSHVPCSHQTAVFHIPFRTKVTILIHLHAYMSHAHGDMITLYVPDFVGLDYLLDIF